MARWSICELYVLFTSISASFLISKQIVAKELDHKVSFLYCYDLLFYYNEKTVIIKYHKKLVSVSRTEIHLDTVLHDKVIVNQSITALMSWNRKTRQTQKGR